MKNLKSIHCLFSKSVKVASLITFALLLFTNCQNASSTTDLWVYDVPGGSAYSSSDYSVTVEQNGKSYPSFVHYSFGRNEYKRYSSNNMQRFQTVTVNEAVRTMVSHSTAIFSFSGSVTVRVTINPGTKHITLPLKSAKVLPSSYDIPCTIENGNTIVFTLDRPEKVAIIPNYDEAWQVFEERGKNHVPIRNWNFNYAEETSRDDFNGESLHMAVSEGYKNPLFVIALPPEKKVPEKDSPQTLVVNPGDNLTQEVIDQYETIWFTPGVHDLSKMGSPALYTTMINSGQTFYLEGGSYVMARVKKNLESGSEGCSIIGRGMISGINHEFVQMGSLNSATLIHIDTIVGISVTDRSCFGIHGGHLIEDVSMLGAWHGNNDGPDFLDDCLIQNCFLQAHDDNLKLNNNTHAKHIVIWQNENAHPIMVKEMRNDVTFANCIVEDVDIIAHFRPFWNNKFDHIGMASIASINSRKIDIENLVFRDIRIEAPYIYRVFSFYNLDSNLPLAPGWLSNAPSSESSHTRINGLTFENITVNTPVILFRSLLGSAYDNSMSNVRFKNISINGTLVTEENKDDFIEIEYDQIDGLIFE
jgi:hypothetical protein